MIVHPSADPRGSATTHGDGLINCLALPVLAVAVPMCSIDVALVTLESAAR